MSKKQEIGVSKKIVAINERDRLKQIARSFLKEDDFGLILRTGSQGKTAVQLEKELTELLTVYKKVISCGQYAKAPCIVRNRNNLLDRLDLSIQEFINENVDSIVVNDESQLEQVRNIAAEAGNNIAVEVYKGEIPMFTAYFITSQLHKALSNIVWLKSGGFLMIEQTEACVVIDVNTGKFLGNKNQQQTALKTNKEAAVEIARQIRLRNLSGMIIVDFINLKAEDDKKDLIHLLKEAVKHDRLAVSVLGMVYLGVVMLTRKKTRESIGQLLLEKCPCCHGTGIVDGRLC